VISSKPFLAGFLLLMSCVPRTQAQTATVNWNNQDQVIDGFGASDAFENSPMTSSQAALFFSPTTGVGLSLVRTKVPDDGSCATINATCAGEVSDMQLAVANGARVWSTSFSPPASMTTNGSVDCTAGTGNGSLKADAYSAFATYLANHVRSLTSLYGISPYAVSVQNEPFDCEKYDSAAWTPEQLDAFVKINLGPTFASAGLSTTLIVMPESSRYGSLVSLAGETMGDPDAAAYVGINAWHDYDDAPSVTNPYASQNKRYWETEVSALPGVGPSLCGGCWDPSIADALLWAQIVDNRIAVANANAWHYWRFIGLNPTDNEGLINPSGPVSKRLYMLGNYSKFVRPGSYRIDATHTPQSGVLVSAYKTSASGALVIVVINQNSSNVSQSFELNGTTLSSVTPWITSADLNLAEQAAVTVSGGSFTFVLPGSSITSFVGNTKITAGASAPKPPTRLAATVKQ
jgi:glucuronoarabinoxylan endo-1,4-beta-xylanase